MAAAEVVSRVSSSASDLLTFSSPEDNDYALANTPDELAAGVLRHCTEDHRVGAFNALGEALSLQEALSQSLREQAEREAAVESLDDLLMHASNAEGGNSFGFFYALGLLVDASIKPGGDRGAVIAQTPRLISLLVSDDFVSASVVRLQTESFPADFHLRLVLFACLSAACRKEPVQLAPGLFSSAVRLVSAWTKEVRARPTRMLLPERETVALLRVANELGLRGLWEPTDLVDTKLPTAFAAPLKDTDDWKSVPVIFLSIFVTAIARPEYLATIKRTLAVPMLLMLSTVVNSSSAASPSTASGARALLDAAFCTFLALLFYNSAMDEDAFYFIRKAVDEAGLVIYLREVLTRCEIASGRRASAACAWALRAIDAYVHKPSLQTMRTIRRDVSLYYQVCRLSVSTPKPEGRLQVSDSAVKCLRGLLENNRSICEPHAQPPGLRLIVNCLRLLTMFVPGHFRHHDTVRVQLNKIWSYLDAPALSERPRGPAEIAAREELCAHLCGRVGVTLALEQMLVTDSSRFYFISGDNVTKKLVRDAIERRDLPTAGAPPWTSLCGVLAAMGFIDPVAAILAAVYETLHAQCPGLPLTLAQFLALAIADTVLPVRLAPTERPYHDLPRETLVGVLTSAGATSPPLVVHLGTLPYSGAGVGALSSLLAEQIARFFGAGAPRTDVPNFWYHGTRASNISDILEQLRPLSIEAVDFGGLADSWGSCYLANRIEIAVHFAMVSGLRSTLALCVFREPLAVEATSGLFSLRFAQPDLAWKRYVCLSRCRENANCMSSELYQAFRECYQIPTGMQSVRGPISDHVDEVRLPQLTVRTILTRDDVVESVLDSLLGAEQWALKNLPTLSAWNRSLCGVLIFDLDFGLVHA